MGIGTNDFKAYESGEGKVCIQAKWPIRPELIPVSVGVFLLPPGWDVSSLQGFPPALRLLVPIYTPWWREAQQCPQPGLEPGLPDLEK